MYEYVYSLRKEMGPISACHGRNDAPIFVVSHIFECRDEFGSPKGTDGVTTGAKILGLFRMRAKTACWQ